MPGWTGLSATDAADVPGLVLTLKGGSTGHPGRDGCRGCARPM